MAKVTSPIPLSRRHAAPEGASPASRTLPRWLGGYVGRRAERKFRVRLVVQSVFAFICLLLGVQFARFVTAADAGTLPLPARPAGAEAFLPISGLMGLLDWAYQGTLNVIHPAASVLVLLAAALALLFRKSFCSWVCPVGFLSEWLARLGRLAFGRNALPWRWLDAAGRSVKYLLLAFFAVSIALMSPAALREFLDSPYNRVADVKMGLFFTQMGPVGLSVMAVLVLGSVIVPGLWCRYLCPYGALLGLLSRFSPSRIQRNASACVSCGLCDKACAARQPVSTSPRITSVDCTGCLDCVASCPVPGALRLQVGPKPVSPVRYAAAIVGLFLAGYVGARASGTWHSGIAPSEYVERIQNIHSGDYGHPGMRQN